ncbi:MAG: DUF1573 domain-containing protein [Flavobacteriales bacterium]|nr:DUF1573 domain-containing protein [Flavobacteriales bacterium]
MVNNVLNRLSRIIVGAFFMLFTLVSLGQAEIKFEEKVQKFEKTKPGPVLEFDYSFTNTGDQPLIITELKVTCTCTKFTFPKEPIAVGEKAIVHVAFDTNHKIGYQDRIIEIYSNAKSSPDKIRFKGVVDNK